jgi:hypothetical protein
MAGPHQIWKLDVDAAQVSRFAGTGREARLDGPLEEAAFAQPSGLTSDGGGKTLYVADSESNIIRALELGPKGEARTLVGGNLFDFGDADGIGDEVRLQHPLGIAATHDGRVFIADTYNHKIKELNPQARTVKTFLGTGKPGQIDGAQPSFYEPGGLSIAGDKLYVADTNNHAVRVVDLKTKRVTTLMLRGLQPPATSAASEPDNAAAPNAEEIKLAPQRIANAGEAALVVDVSLPAGYHLNNAAPQRYNVSVEKGASILALAGDSPKSAARTAKDLQLPLRLPLRTLSTGAAELRIALTIYYCREDNTGTCRIKTLLWRAPVEVVAADTSVPREIKAQAKIE